MMEFFKGTVTPKDWAAVGVILGITVALCAVFYLLVYRAQGTNLESIRAEDAKVVAEVQAAQKLKENIAALEAETEKMQTLVAQFEERLPESREIPTLLRQFEGFAREIGLRVQLEQLPKVTDANKETIPYSVKASGSFHDIVSFINRLERFKRYLKVSDLDMGEEEAGVSECSFTLSTYRFIQANEGSPS